VSCVGTSPKSVSVNVHAQIGITRFSMSNPSRRDPHQPYPDVKLSSESIEVENVERMEGEGGHPFGFEGDLGPVLSFPGKEWVQTPRTQPAEEGWADETAEGAREEEIVTPTARGCSCNCPGVCPKDCPASCQCAGHLRNQPTYNVSGDEP